LLVSRESESNFGHLVSSEIDRFTGRVDVLPRVAYRFRALLTFIGP